MAFKLNDFKRLIREALGNAYRILGVSPNATPEEIKAAYRKLAIQLHPDRNQGTDTTAKAAKVNVAWSILSDPVKRAKYDKIGDRTVDDEGEQPASQQSTRSDWDDFIRNAWANRPGSNTNQPPPRPRPAADRREFVKDDRKRGGTSYKFWRIERIDLHTIRVSWGRVGTPGQTKTHYFDDVVPSSKYWYKMIQDKLKKGYVEQRGASPPPKSGPAPSAKQQPPPAAKQPASKTPSGRTPKNKTVYKIYGKKGKAPVHTRYGGKVYAPTGTTRFRPGDSASVGLGSDGRLGVHDSSSGRTQTWDNTNEASQWINEMVVRYLVDHLTVFNDDE